VNVIKVKKKLVAVCLLGVLLLILSGCIASSFADTPSSTVSTHSNTEALSPPVDMPYDTTTKPYIDDASALCPDDTAEKGLSTKDDIPESSRYELLIIEKLGYSIQNAPYIEEQQVETGLLAYDTMSTVVVFGAYVYGETVAHASVIVVDTGSDIVCEILGEGRYFTDFSLADIDGDGYAEILMHHETGGNGGAGSHETAVYKLEGNKLKKLFYYPVYNNSEGIYHNDFNTGFTLTLSDGWTYTVGNKNTDFSLTYIRKTLLENPYFDEVGNITAYAKDNNEQGALGTDPFFFVFCPLDVDNDGIFEIMTAQYASLWGRADGLGVAYSILKWNNSNSNMDIINAGFWVYQDDFEDMDDYYQRWQEYEDNWYMD